MPAKKKTKVADALADVVKKETVVDKVEERVGANLTQDLKEEGKKKIEHAEQTVKIVGAAIVTAILVAVVMFLI